MLRLTNAFSNWTSGNSRLDQFIQQTQLENPDSRFHMQWINYDDFSDIKFVAKGGHSSVYSATWLNKTDQVWDGVKQTFVEKPLVVALKVLKDSQNLSNEFLDEFMRHASLKLDGCVYTVHCHGVTRHPETQEYIMVMNYAEDGDLRQYLQRHIDTLRWKDIVDILRDVAMGLLNIHKNKTYHKNLHC
ncbi:10074_t:CDS:2, partial [Acaulospora morrowiae]